MAAETAETAKTAKKAEIAVETAAGAAEVIKQQHRRWRAPAGGSYIVLLLTVIHSYRRRESPPSAHRSQEALPLEDAIPGIFHYPQLSCLSASSRQSLCSTLTLSSQSLPLGGAARERGAAMGRVLSCYLSNSLSLSLFCRHSRVH